MDMTILLLVLRTPVKMKMKIFWFLYVILNHSLILGADNSYNRCYSNHSGDGVYFSSRDSQLLSLADKVRNYGGYYYSANSITTPPPPEPVPDCLGLCRKDLISSEACHDCISNSASDLVRNCAYKNQVVAWGADAGCVVQSVPPNLELDDTQFSYHVCNSTSVSANYLSQFGNILANLTLKLAAKAGEEGASSSFPIGFSAPQYFATGKSRLGDDITIYAAGFCLPKLSASDCTACLKANVNQSENYCKGKQGGEIFTPSCVLRYELYPFYTTSSVISPPSPPVTPSSNIQKDVRKVRTGVSTIVLPITVVVTLIIFMAGIWIVLMKRRKQHWNHKDDSIGAESLQSCLEFNLNTVRIATNYFSESNKLGQGGFGAVYKGRLPNGLQVAVKRLTRWTAHGEADFKNEVQLVARLHHRNLARLIGFCMGTKERILIYEFAHNGSLDRILFDINRRESLTWKIRYSIIEGIARGLLYLHEESQLRIIHRDLKASNVLLDESMNPKICDFGTAKLFVEDNGTASHIVGTYGYMPPEYAKFGKISIKIDVFSFGVLLLEIISGRKNSVANNKRQMEHLLSRTWKCWTEGQLLQLIDPVLLRENSQTDDIMRCIHIGLLCVQEKVSSRPTMSLVILDLEGLSRTLPSPTEPAYLMQIDSDQPSVSTMENNLVPQGNDTDTDTHTDKQSNMLSLSSGGVPSINQVSFTDTFPQPR